MNYRNRIKRILIASVCSAFLLSVDFLLMPYASYLNLNKNIKTVSIICGLIFWITLVLTLILSMLASVLRNKSLKNSDCKEKIKGVGALKFFSNLPAEISDIVFFISIIGMIITMLVKSDFAIFVFIALTVFTFFMHCVFNGKNYAFVKSSKLEGIENE